MVSQSQLGAMLGRFWLNLNHNRILRAAAAVGSTTVLIKVLSLLKDLSVALHMGTSASLDAYLLALMIPLYIINILGGSLGYAVVPIFISEREAGNERAASLLSRVLIRATLLGLALVVVLMVLAPIAIAALSGNLARHSELLLSASYVLLPVAALGMISNLLSAVLSALGRFKIAATSQAFVPLCILVGVWAASDVSPLGALAGSTVLGYLLELLYLSFFLRRLGFVFGAQDHMPNAALGSVYRQLLPLIGSATVLGSTTVFNQTYAATFGPGSVSVLNYGIKVTSLFNGVVIMAVGTAMLPFVSRMVAAQDWREVRGLYRKWTLGLLALTLPVSLLVGLLSPVIVSLLFQRGNFTEQDVIAVAAIQTIYAFQIPFYALGILTARYLSAMGYNKVLLLSDCMSCAANLVLCISLSHFFGVRGVAMSVSLMYLFSYIYCGYRLRKILELKCEGSNV